MMRERFDGRLTLSPIWIMQCARDIAVFYLPEASVYCAFSSKIDEAKSSRYNTTYIVHYTVKRSVTTSNALNATAMEPPVSILSTSRASPSSDFLIVSKTTLGLPKQETWAAKRIHRRGKEENWSWNGSDNGRLIQYTAMRHDGAPKLVSTHIGMSIGSLGTPQ